MKAITYFLIISSLLVGCSKSRPYKVIADNVVKSSNETTQFTLIPVAESSVNFENTVKETETLNFLNFSNIYNGGGVATADFNNDGLVDIYFTANQQSNKLYINKGNFKFEDITKNAGVEDLGGWTTGVSVVDINNDGWLDIYVSKSGVLNDKTPKENKLYINLKNNTFKESAKEWKVNDAGFSTQSYFLDFDKDGDLDMYLVNHRPDFHNSGTLNMRIEKEYSEFSSDKLYRNDGDFFTEITHKAGLVNKAWGLSASIGDFNNDNWPDVYVCNDFLSPDMLYINNKNGTFSNQILDRMNHISFSSMGSDYADINNDLLPDLFVLEMASEDHIRSKKNMATMSTSNFNTLVEKKYHHQYMVNTLQLNNGNGQFSEIAQISGLAKTDWSWAPLFADFDNDGLKDVFVTNGILKDMGNQDFRTELNEKFAQDNKPSFNDITALMPSTKVHNYSFKNKGDYKFNNVSEDWGFDAKTQSNGAAYADLDNDGDLDLVINNINDIAQIYKNNDANNFIQLRLKGDSKNKFAIGAKATISINGKKQYQELYTSRGFISSVQDVMHFGLGEASEVDKIVIEWPDNKVTTLNAIDANQIIVIDKKTAKPQQNKVEKIEPLLTQPTNSGITFKHKESKFNDYENQILLPHSQSHNGPFIDKADVNGDGLEDFFVGGAANQAGELYIQDKNGNFVKKESKTWTDDAKHEDLGVLFFDADNDKDADLYIVSGSSEFKEGSELFQDRLYLNDGDGNYTKVTNALPNINSSGQSVAVSDIDKDGDLDLFVGGRTIPDKYPFAPESYILINENGRFINRTITIAPLISNIGMVTDAIFSDYDTDGDEDLIVVGEWMPITLFENVNGKLEHKENESLRNTEGLWFSIAGNDIDNDGDVDYFLGNLGKNTKYKASTEKPFHVFCDDFDNSGTYDIVLTSNYKGTLVPSRGRECSSQQMPFIKDKFPTFTSFAEASLEDIYGDDKLKNALHYQAKKLESVFLENLGNGKFAIHHLPNQVQLSPIMSFEFLDIDNDNYKEIIIVGNHYKTEAETVRYDASYGSVLSYKNGKFSVRDTKNTGFSNKGNAKSTIIIDSKDKKQLLVANNNERIRVFNIDKN
ncbi:VCBS repeat-containing protein [Aureibaculum conchae]|uniref:VCBS repeat-containing protein n=1 Tax=Aureibaculum sp. 2308TA14-22 TaxID=3108392 RepID=UPI003391E63F